MSKLKEKYTPVLNRYLLEGAFAESMNQVLMSLDQCRIYKKTDMTIAQHIRALWGITMDETGVPVLLTDGRHEDTMIKKHRYFIRRVKSLRADLLNLDPNIESNMPVILKAITTWIQDAHLILHEDTPSDTRKYLSEKGGDAPKAVEGVQ